MSVDFFGTLKISETGLKAQAGRMRVVAENIANADSIAKDSNTEPYRRKMVRFSSYFDHHVGADVVRIGRIEYDQSDFKTRYEPGHPNANENGYISLPNVDTVIEVADMSEAQRSYQANMNVITATRTMVQLTIDMMA